MADGAQLAACKPSSLCRAARRKSAPGCWGTDRAALEEEAQKRKTRLEVTDCALSTCASSLLFKGLFYTVKVCVEHGCILARSGFSFLFGHE